jgi:alkylation response protein AidB-like acyl-CoA dehydrogenase
MPTGDDNGGGVPPGGTGGDEPAPSFEARVRAFLAARVGPRASGESAYGVGDDALPGLSDSSAEDEVRKIAEARRWQRTLYDHGWAWVDGGAVDGGVGLGTEEAELFRRLEADFDTPDRGGLLVGLSIVTPAIIEHGTPAQRDELVRPLLRGDQFACLLLSEPGTGSDLGAMTTRARRDGDEWLLNGQKGWGSYAQFSDVGLLLARTDPEAPREQGLTMFLIDMHQPGVEIQPTRHMTGGAHFSDVFLSDARVADSRRIGGVGDGWQVAMTAVRNERGAAGASHDAPPTELVARLGQLWAHTEADSALRAVRRGDLASAVVLGRVLENTNDRLMPAATTRPGLETSITKLLRNQFLTAAVETGCAIAGPAAAAQDGNWGRYVWGRARVSLPGFRLAGGSDEIQRNLLAERVLGLPREPRPPKPSIPPPGPATS